MRPAQQGHRQQGSPERLGAQHASVVRHVARRRVDVATVVLVVEGADERFRDVESISILGLRSVLAIPLHEQGDVVGAIYLDNRLQRRAFGPEDLRMLEALALRFGDPIAAGYHALPDWDRLATIPRPANGISFTTSLPLTKPAQIMLMLRRRPSAT